MKYTLLILAASVALAADPPKPVQPTPLPEAAKVQILDAKQKLYFLYAEQQEMLVRANKKGEEVSSASAALGAVQAEVMKANGCAAITPDLQCVPAPKEAKAEKK